MRNNTIEARVQLGLSSAIEQANRLKQVVNESVKPDSSAYQEILSILGKIQNAADGLKGKMDSAFKTSSGTKSFLKDYEKLLSLINTAKVKFGNIGLEGLKLTDAEQDSVNTMLQQLRSLEKEIDTINKGKIGKIFDDSSAAGAEKVRETIANLGGEVDKITFGKLSNEIRKEATSVNNEIDSITSRIGGLQQQLDSLSGTKLTSFTDKIRGALDLATTKTTFKSENLFQYTEALKNFYDQYQGYSGKQGNVKAGGDIQKFLEQESNSIRDAIVKMKEQIPEYKAALEELKSLYQIPKGGSAADQKARADEIGAQFGIVGNKDEGNWIKYIKSIETQISDAFKTANLGEEMLNNIKNIFDGMDVNKVVSADKLRAQLKTIFTEAFGKDILEDTNIQNIFNSISKDMDFTNFMQTVQTGLTGYADNLRAAITNLNQDLSQFNATKATLADAEKLVTDGSDGEVARLNSLLQSVEQVNGALQQLIAGKRENAQTKFEVPGADDNLKKARTALEEYIVSTQKLESQQKSLSNVRMAVDRWMGFWQVLNLTKRAITDMKQHVQELDQVMTKIAVVTNMSQSDLWGQIGKYSEIARQYGVAIKGVYEVSQIYYQQGLQQGDVMTLTQETLKMARIAGIDYSTAADYMTTAIRGFKLEMTDAAHVTDVFSNLAAHTASSTEELATAISKTAASAASVGASFESTSAMMATMIATTRESATNIGTALKSIIARYGEMKANVTGIDDEGEEYSLNKVDKALQTIGVSIHDAAGQFRDFDDVILELAEAWQSIDTNTQRYIATVMAGNRQQSRFLALVSNVEEYKKALELANNADNAGELQTLKTLDSVDAKIEQMKVTVQEFYTSSGIENLYKGILDTITNVISAANDLPKVIGNFPATAVAVGLQVVNAIKNILRLIIITVQSSLESIRTSGKNLFSTIVTDSGEAGTLAGRSFVERFQEEMKKLKAAGITGVNAFVNTSAGKMATLYAASALSTAGAALSVNAMSQYGASKSADTDRAAGWGMAGAAGLSGTGSLLSGIAMGHPIVGVISGILSALPSVISAISMHTVTLARQIELDEKNVNEAKANQVKAQGEVDELSQAREKFITLKEAASSSSESLKEFTDYQNQLGDSYPLLVSKMDEVGNKTIDLATLENELASARTSAAEATVDTITKEEQLAKDQRTAYEKLAQNTRREGNFFNYSPGSEGFAENGSYTRWAQNSLHWLLSDFKNSIKDVDIAKIFGLEDVDDIYEIEDNNKLLELVSRVNNWAQQNLDKIDNAQKRRAESKTYYTALTEVNKQFELLDNTTRNKYLDKGYDKFITSMISRFYNRPEYNEKGGIDFSTETYEFQRSYDRWLQWAQEHQEAVKWLQESFNIENYRSAKDLTADLTNKDKGALDDWYVIWDYESEWSKTMKTIREHYDRGIEDYLNVYQDKFTELFDEETPDDNVKSEFTPQLQSAFKRYYDLRKQGLTGFAMSYIDSAYNLFSAIGKLKPAQQDEIQELIAEVNLEDKDSLTETIESLSKLNIEGKYDLVLQALIRARERIAENASTLILQLADEAPKVAENVEKLLKDFGKGLEYSDALKKAQDIINKSTDTSRTAAELIKFDKDLGQWTLTLDGFTEGYEQLIESYSDGLASANDNIQMQITALSSYLETGSMQELQDLTFTTATGKTQRFNQDMMINFSQKMQNWQAEAESQGVDLNEYLEQQLEDLQKLSESQIPALRRVLDSLPLTLLIGFDWSGFADGTVTKDKGIELLTFYLEKIGIQTEELSEKIIEDLLKGEFSSFEELLSGHGYENIISKAIKLDAKKANIEQYKTAISELTSVGSIISEETQRAAKELNISVDNVAAGSENAVVAAKTFLDTLASCIGQAGYTLNDFNSDAKALLDATLFNRGGKGGDMLDFAAGDITSDSLETLANKFGKRLTEIVDVSSGEVIGDLGKHLSYNVLTNKYEIQGTFDSFISALESQFQVTISRTSYEYLSALEAYNQSKIEKSTKISDKVFEAIKGISEAQPGKQVDVSYLTTFADEELNNYIARLGGVITDGILTLSRDADIQGIVQALGSAAAQAGALIPEQIAELNDAIVSVLQQIASLISNGINGKLSNTDRFKLQEWATSNELGDLHFAKTAEGWQLIGTSITEVINKVAEYDSVQAEALAKEHLDYLQKVNERYQTIGANTNYLKNLKEEASILDEEIRYQKQLKTAQKAYNKSQEKGIKPVLEAFEELRGNTDMYNRAIIDNADGSWSTILGTEYYDVGLPEQNVHVLMTPIPEWAEVESDILPMEELDKYLNALMEGHPIDVDALLKLDAEGIDIDGKHIANMIIDIKNAASTSKDKFHEGAISLHEWSAAWESIRSGKEAPDNSGRLEALEQELTLAKEIQRIRSTSEDASFNFMSNKIPGGQNNPLNYYSSWAQAFSKLKDAFDLSKVNKKGKAGFIDYEDWYNIVTELNNIAALGEPIEIAGKKLDGSLLAASELIQEGANALTTVDTGEIKVNLGAIGTGIASAGEFMNEGVTKGIQAMAESQVNMLDGLIQLLETIVAMQELGDIDVDGNGIDLSEIFQVNDDTGAIEDWSEGWKKIADSILKSAKTNDALNEALDSVTINGESLRNYFTKAGETWSGTQKEAEAYTAVMRAFYEAARSGNYDPDHIMESIKQVLGTSNLSDQTLEIDIGDLHLSLRSGVLITRNSEGNYIVGNQEFSNIDSAIQYEKERQLAETQHLVNTKRNEETGTLEVSSSIVTAIHYDVENEGYTVTFSDGTTVSSNSEAGVNLAIATYSNMIGGEKEATIEAEPITFTIHRNANEIFEVTVNGENVDVTASTSGADAEDIKSRVQALLAQEATPPDVTVPAEADVTLDLSGKKVVVDTSGAEVVTKTDTLDLTQNIAQVNGKADKFEISSDNVTAGEEITVPVSASLENTIEADDIAPSSVEVEVVPNAQKLDNSEIVEDPINVDIFTDAPELEPSEIIESPITVEIDANINPALSAIQQIQAAASRPAYKTVYVNESYRGGRPKATGNVGAANAQGTLMGELGPELVVSNGRYFVAGQNGAEFVNLADDAIVFNHLQTKSLFDHGMSKSRGRAITNERKAVAYVQGNMAGGPAKASASAALAALKELRAQWQALAGLSAKDLAGKGGGGGGGGGDEKLTNFLKDLEKWYNWLQRIAVLEEKINYEEAKRTKWASDFEAHGDYYHNSQKETLAYLKEQVGLHQDLYESQEAYFEQRRAEMNNAKNPFQALYTFDEYGQLKYTKDSNGKSALEKLSYMVGRNELTGEPNMTAEEQYKQWIAWGFEKYMEYDSSGAKIEKEAGKEQQFYENSVKAIWDKIDADKEEMQALHDSIEEHRKAVVDGQNAINEILQAIRDNQIELEKDVLKALEEVRQREIDDTKDTKEAIKESADAVINGLNEQLQREQKMYQNQQNQNEVTKLQRQLSILQRSGGSAAEIANLQKQISDKQQQTYFDIQQQQIDAMREASDSQIDRLDRQISLMEEELAYEKEHGLLWQQVYWVMSQTPEQITQFIADNTKDYWGQSAVEYEKSFTEELFKAQQWAAYRDSIEEIKKFLLPEEEKKSSEKASETTSSTGTIADLPAATSNSGGGGGGNANSGQKFTSTKYWTVYDDKGNETYLTIKASSKEEAKKELAKQMNNSPYYSIGSQTTYQDVQKKNQKMADAQKKYKTYDYGGMVEEDGLAYVHADEGVLTPEQTRAIREKLLGSQSNSFLSRMEALQYLWDKIGETSLAEKQSTTSTVIERAEMVMNVKEISSDYDTRRMVDTAYNELLNIARKTSANNRVGG